MMKINLGAIVHLKLKQNKLNQRTAGNDAE